MAGPSFQVNSTNPSSPASDFHFLNPVPLMIFGGASVLLGMYLADVKHGDACLDRHSQKQADDLMDILGKSVYADITGPFTVHENQTDYAECILGGQFEVSGISGTCEDLSKAGVFNPSRATFSELSSFSWDISACAKYIQDDDKSELLKPWSMRVRSSTTDLADAIHALCSDDAGYLRILAQHLPSDRPLLTLDAGAHIGAETLLFAAFSRFWGKILAIEPHPASLAVLRSNTANPPHFVSRIKAALTATDAAASDPSMLLTGPEGQFSSWQLLLHGAAPPGSIRVRTITLMRALDFTRSKKFDVVKLDIGGMEAQLMADLASRAVLCQATCLVTSLGAGGEAKAQYDAFLSSGCPSSHRLIEVGLTGRYRVLCQEKTVHAARLGRA